MRRELTWQAALIAIVVAALVSASYPYVVLKLGMGPNISVVSAFLGAILLFAVAPGTHGRNRWMNNVVQTAGTSAASTAFMCVVAAAVDLASQNPTMTDSLLNGIHHIDPWPMFWWLSCAGGIGVLFTVLFRRHFLDDPKMIFADGVAAAETIVVLDTPGSEAAGKIGVLGFTALASALVDWLREGVRMVIPQGRNLLPDYHFGQPLLASYGFGIEWNLLSLGSGLLVGLNVGLSLLAGSVIFAAAGSHLIQNGTGRDIVLSNVAADFRPDAARLIDRDWNDLSDQEQQAVSVHSAKMAAYMQKDYFPTLLLWFMWPATGLMIASALTALLIKARLVLQSFTQLRAPQHHAKREDVSLGTIVLGSLLLTVALAIIQHLNFNMSYLQTAVAVLCSLPLMLVGIRVLGETNNGPISVMMNGLQAVFAVFWPSNVGHNLIAAGMTGTCNSQAEGTMQDYKTGQIIGSTPRVLTWVQLLAVPIGAAAVAIMYPLLLRNYRLGIDLTTPTGVKISNMAVLLSRGIDALPRGALFWTILASVAGVLATIAKDLFHIRWFPSPVGIGFGLLLPGTLNIMMAIGGFLGWTWEKWARTSYERYAVTVASGLIAGEAMLGGLILPVLSWFLAPGNPP